MNPEQNPQVQQLIAQLNGIIEPEPSFALAYGWWILSGLILIIIALLALKLFGWHKSRVYRVSARKLVNQLIPSSTLSYAYSMNQILKRTAISAYGRNKVAHLQGREWIEFLIQTKGSAQFPSEIQDLLNFGLYQAQYPFDSQQLKSFTLAWIGSHSPALAKQRMEAASV